MIKDPVLKKVEQWDDEANGNDFLETHGKITFLSKNLFVNYGVGESDVLPKFNVRLNSWLDNLEDSNDQKLLFKLVLEIFYLSPKDAKALYVDAYQTIYECWLIDVLGLSFMDAEIHNKLHAGIINSWFCPITDSFKITEFYHFNEIPGTSNDRPEWRTIKEFGDPEKVKAYASKNNKKYLILLEDFIGSATQTFKTIEFTANNFPEMKILIIPLILCPKGDERLKELTDKFKNLTVRPVVKFQQDSFIQKDDNPTETTFFKEIRQLAYRSYKQVAQENADNDDKIPGGPLGFKFSGGLIVMHTNTPNNTLPLIHYKSSAWNPLFLRHIRYQK